MFSVYFVLNNTEFRLKTQKFSVLSKSCTQFQILTRKLQVLVIFKIFEVNVDVVIIRGSHHLKHLDLRLITRLLLGLKDQRVL